MLKYASLTAAGLVVAASLVTIPASAAPFGPVRAEIGNGTAVTQIGWRCGRGRHWSYRLQHCVWN